MQLCFFFVVVANLYCIIYPLTRSGAYGKNDCEASLIDMMNDSVEDLRLKYIKLIYQEFVSTVNLTDVHTLEI